MMTHLESSQKIAATTTEKAESSETLLVMQRKHSMFMNCIPAMQKIWVRMLLQKYVPL